ncbi:MAG: hypothetical protein ACXWM7_00090 [Parachlamydiaceae bacterium]
MDSYVLNTYQGIYETTIAYFPSASIKIEQQETKSIAIKILLNSQLPEIELNGAVFKGIFQTRLHLIKVLHDMNSPISPSLLNPNYCLNRQPLVDVIERAISDRAQSKAPQLTETSPLERVPEAMPKRMRTRTKTWPNPHSLFTLATLISNVACLVFPYPILIGINVAIRCASIVFASSPLNKAKTFTDMISIVAILIIKNGAMLAIAFDLAFEAINFSRCEISRELYMPKYMHLGILWNRIF